MNRNCVIMECFWNAEDSQLRDYGVFLDAVDIRFVEYSQLRDYGVFLECGGFAIT